MHAVVSPGGDCSGAEGRGQRCTGGALDDFKRGYFDVSRSMLLRSYGDDPRGAGAQGDEIAWVLRSKPITGETQPHSNEVSAHGALGVTYGG